MADCKLGEKGCWKDGKCHFSGNCDNKEVTNADHIREMDDKQLAAFLAAWAQKSCAWRQDESEVLRYLNEKARENRQ